MDEMVELLDADLTQANTEAIIESVGTVCQVARQQMSTEAKVRLSLCHQLEVIESGFSQSYKIGNIGTINNFHSHTFGDSKSYLSGLPRLRINV